MPLLTCPNDNVAMTAVKREGVEIDMCPQCRGVWLDRGELEKLLGVLRAADVEDQRPVAPGAATSQQPYPPQQPYPQQPYPPQRGYSSGHGERGEYGEHGEYGERGEYGHGRYRKRRFGLFDIFD